MFSIQPTILTESSMLYKKNILRFCVDTKLVSVRKWGRYEQKRTDH